MSRGKRAPFPEAMAPLDSLLESLRGGGDKGDIVICQYLARAVSLHHP